MVSLVTHFVRMLVPYEPGLGIRFQARGELYNYDMSTLESLLTHQPVKFQSTFTMLRPLLNVTTKHPLRSIAPLFRSITYTVVRMGEGDTGGTRSGGAASS